MKNEYNSFLEFGKDLDNIIKNDILDNVYKEILKKHIEFFDKGAFRIISDILYKQLENIGVIFPLR